jgi:aldehyde:ferredoxin oxidoreductase
VGGHIGAELKYAGFDAVVIRGAAKSLSYLSISPSKVEIRECPDLAGLGTFRSEEKIKEVEKDEKLKVLAIGPAGENRVLFSCVSSERYRQLGRGGIGAVMGSKNLKGIAVRGWLDVHVADVGKLMDLAKEVHTKDAVTAIGNDMYVYGTPILVDLSNKAGLPSDEEFPGGMFRESGGDQRHDIPGSPEEQEGLLLLRDRLRKLRGCRRVPGRGPRYETIALCGSSIGNGDPAKLIELNSICDDLGLDSISAGGVVAYMMEATEKGVHDFGIRFGEADKAARYMKTSRSSVGSARKRPSAVRSSRKSTAARSSPSR